MFSCCSHLTAVPACPVAHAGTARSWFGMCCPARSGSHPQALFLTPLIPAAPGNQEHSLLPPGCATAQAGAPFPG